MLALFAAIPMLAEPRMDNALGHLRTNLDGVAVVLSGSETAGRALKTFRADGYVKMTLDGTLRAEFMSYESGAGSRTLERTHWIVVDGKNIFSYQKRGNQYSSLGMEAEPPTKTLRTVNNLVSGKLKPIVQLFQDIYNPVEWQPWMLQARRSEEGPDILFGTGTETGHFYRFRVPENNENQSALTDLWYGYRVPERSVDWHMTIAPGGIPATVQFRFAPPTGSRAVALPASNTVQPN